MSWIVQILRDGALEKTYDLDVGEHAIGRAEDNRIPLADKAVSGRHAVLFLDKKSALLRDADSRNGVLVAGAKIAEMRFTDAFEARIGPYSLRAAPKAAERTKSPGAPLRPLVYALLLVLAGVISLLNALPQQVGFADFRDREVLKRGILLGRYLAEVNTLPLQSRAYDQIRTITVSQEEGVTFAYVVDATGKILAPASDLGKSLDKPPYDQGLRDKTLKVWDGEQGLKIIFYPIKNTDLYIGAAVLGYDVGRAAALMNPGAEKWLLPLIFSLGCGVLAAFFLLRLFFSPLAGLAEELGLCLKQRRDSLNYATRNPEFLPLVDACNRLLLQAARPGQPGREPNATASAEPAATAPNEAHSAPSPDEAWCRLDLDTHRVLDHNEAFGRLPGAVEQARGLHLLEVFADPELLQTVSSLLEDPAAEARAHSGGQPSFLVLKRVDPATPRQLALTFTETPDG